MLTHRDFFLFFCKGQLQENGEDGAQRYCSVFQETLLWLQLAVTVKYVTFMFGQTVTYDEVGSPSTHYETDAGLMWPVMTVSVNEAPSAQTGAFSRRSFCPHVSRFLTLCPHAPHRTSKSFTHTWQEDRSDSSAVMMANEHISYWDVFFFDWGGSWETDDDYETTRAESCDIMLNLLKLILNHCVVSPLPLSLHVFLLYSI